MLTSKASAIVVMMPGALVFMVLPPNNTFSMANKHNAKCGRDPIEIGVSERQCFGIANAEQPRRPPRVPSGA
jgi:hypothetical protein